MRKLLIATGLLAAVAVPAMAQRNATADWFLAHPDEANKEVVWCQDHPTEQENQLRANDYSCVHASEAIATLRMRETRGVHSQDQK